MKIVDILSEDLIVAEMKAKNKPAAIEEVVTHIARVQPQVDKDLAIDVLLERERLGSTGVGQGFAIPHGKLPRLGEVVACFSRSPHGVAFDSLDGSEVHLFFTLLAPQGAAGLHLKALARASRLFKSNQFRRNLIEAKDSQEIWDLICIQDQELNKLGSVND